LREPLKHPKLRRIDSKVFDAVRYISYVTPVVLIFMAVLAVADILWSRLFGKAIPNTNDLIDYFLIFVVYCGAPFIQLKTGLMRVDIFYDKYRSGFKRAVNLFSYTAGTILYALAGYYGISYLTKYYTMKTLAQAATSSFPIWPFALAFVIGAFLLAFTLLWSILRLIWIPDTALRSNTPEEAVIAELGMQEGRQSGK
jgi:TRAP-type C4-dicarboxylate transport system permease small subunit